GTTQLRLGRRQAFFLAESELAGAHHSSNDTAIEVDGAHRAVVSVGEIQIAVGPDLEIVGIADLRINGGTVVAAEARRAGSGQRVDHAGGKVHDTNAIVDRVRDV